VKTLVLAGKEIEKILTMEIAIPAVERAFAAHGRGEAVMPPKLYLPLEKYAGDFRAMPSLLGDAVGVKWVNMHPENPKRFSLPAVMGVYILSDPETAFPLAVMDGTRLTAFRTGAAAAVASKHLAVKSPATVGFIGCGVQARKLLGAHRARLRGFRAIMADVSPRRPRSSPARRADSSGRWTRPAAATSSARRRRRARRSSSAPTSESPRTSTRWAPTRRASRNSIPDLLDAPSSLDDMAQATESGEVNVPLQPAPTARADLRHARRDRRGEEAGAHRDRDHDLRFHRPRDPGPRAGAGGVR
jgi:hypothetical protein